MKRDGRVTSIEAKLESFNGTRIYFFHLQGSSSEAREKSFAATPEFPVSFASTYTRSLNARREIQLSPLLLAPSNEGDSTCEP